MEPTYKIIVCLYEARELMTGREIAEKTGLTEKQVRNACTSRDSAFFDALVVKKPIDTRSKLELNGYQINPKFVHLVGLLMDRS